MKVRIDQARVISLFTEAFGAEHREDSGNHVFEMVLDTFVWETGDTNAQPVTAYLDKDELRQMVAILNDQEVIEETQLASPRRFEVFIRNESPINNRSRNRQKFNIADQEHGVQYLVTSATNEYLVFLLDGLSRADLLSTIKNRMSYDEDDYKDLEYISPFDLIRRNFLQFRTIQITSSKNYTPHDFGRFADAFVFQVCYNLEIALVQQRSLDEVMRATRLARCKRLSPEELRGPQRSYIANLVQHYQLAVAADNVYLQYLSYYHIAEHFFEQVFSDDLENRIMEKITRPDFSHRRRADIKALIKDVSRGIGIEATRC